MSKKPRRRKPSRREVRFVCCLRDFLSPALFRQVQGLIPERFRGKSRPARRWTLRPLLFVLLCMTWCNGDSQPERFETARAFFVACSRGLPLPDGLFRDLA